VELKLAICFESVASLLLPLFPHADHWDVRKTSTNCQH
jgi:hypothetical protein